MEVLSLNLIPTGTTPVVHVKQYDVGRTWRFELKEGPLVYTLDGSETIECDIKKKDGNVVTVAVTNTSASYIDIETTLQMTACSGDNLGAIRLKKGSDDIGTLNFILSCERSPLENGIESESSIHNLEQQIADAVADQYDSNSVIFDDEPTAGHVAPYTVSSEGIHNALDEKPDNLSELGDVNISSPASNQALVWDADNNVWTNGEVSTVGSIDDLDDVDTTGKATGDSLRYDGNEWIAKPTTIALTQAEYDALQTKEPNTHYVITDAPNLNPTASDIEYSSGVSVKQAIDSKQDALSNQAITLTPNTSVLGSSGFTGACYQYGKVVCLFVQTASPTSEVAYQSIFLTGLPKPVYGNDNNRVSLTDRATNKPYRFRITDSGQLQEWYNSSGKIPSGADLYGTIVYLAE